MACWLMLFGMCVVWFGPSGVNRDSVDYKIGSIEREISLLKDTYVDMLAEQTSGQAIGGAARHGHGVRQLFPNPYGQQAIQNLTTFKTHLLSKMTGYLDEDGPKPPNSFDEQFGPFEPFISCPPGRALKRYGGDGDGGKMLCDLSMLTAPCTVYSLGSHGDYSFERSVLQSTSCQVHTFDCTYNGKAIHARHTYHKVCIGKGGKGYKEWDSLVKQLNHDRISLLKIDIEGYEVDVIPFLFPESALPRQISIELHSSPQLPVGPKNHLHSTNSMALFFTHLASLGYGVVSSEMNTLAADRFCCAEFTFLRLFE